MRTVHGEVQPRCFRRRLGRGVPPAAAGAVDGRRSLGHNQSGKSARGKSSPASAPRGVCGSVQPTRSAIKCSKASRSSHTAVRRAPAAPGEGKREVGRQHQSQGTRLRPGHRSGFQSVVLRGGWASPVYVSGRATRRQRRRGRGRRGARGGLPRRRGAGGRAVGEGCQAPRSPAANSHADNLQPASEQRGGVTVPHPRGGRRRQSGSWGGAQGEQHHPSVPEQLVPTEPRATLPRQRGGNFTASGLRPSDPAPVGAAAPLPSEREPAAGTPERRAHPPVLLDAAALGVAGILLLLRVLFAEIHVQLIASFRARVRVSAGGRRAAQRKRPAGTPPRRCGRRGHPTPLSSGLWSLPSLLRIQIEPTGRRGWPGH